MASVLELAGENLVVGPSLTEYENEYVKNTNCFYYGLYDDITTILVNLYNYYGSKGTAKSLSAMWVATDSGTITEGTTSISYNKYDLLITTKSGSTIATNKLKNMVNYGLSSQ